ncbi:unnamed protein product, partial [Strongylus vulgaris]
MPLCGQLLLNFTFAFSGVGCVGARTEPCMVTPVCQEWSQWGPWSMCSTTCGEGERKRSRECIGGRDCPGVSTTVETCVTIPCPIWSSWGPWEGCSVTCGPGQEKRSRKCQVWCAQENVKTEEVAKELLRNDYSVTNTIVQRGRTGPLGQCVLANVMK